MTDWRDTLRRASAVSPDAAAALPAMLDFLEAADAGRASASTVSMTLGEIANRKPTFVDAVDAALRGGTRKEPTLAAARAVLYVLPRLFDRVVALAPMHGVDPAGVRESLAALVAHDAAVAGKGVGTGPLACPRCRSRDVDDRHTNELARRFTEARCNACGAYASWFDGDADERTWDATASLAVRWPVPVARSQLVAAFTDYLRRGARDPRALAVALRDEGFALEGAFVERKGWHDHDGRRVFAGRRPPRDANLGDLWLDTVEVGAMIRMMRPARVDCEPTPGWLAVRPVARWQFRAFVAAAPIVERIVQVRPKEPSYAPARMAAGPDAAPMTSITHGEAQLYTWWFGKTFPSGETWAGAQTLGERGAWALWSLGLREWSNQRCSGDESLRTRIGHDTWSQDPGEEFAAELEDVELDDESRLLVDENTNRPDLGFRTATGDLLLTQVRRLDSFEPIALASLFAR
jgi:hypothetical protein